MVAIPTIVHIGNDELQGTYIRVPLAVVPLPGGWSFYNNRKRLNWAIPNDNDGTGVLSVGVPYLPWFDRTLSGALGNFTPYHVVPGILSAPYNTAQGDNAGAAGDGFGSSAWLMQLFSQYYTTSPYFRYLKVVGAGGIANWKIGGASYNTFNTFATRAKSLVGADTLDAKLIIIDTNGDAGLFAAPGGDIKNIATVGATYKADMMALITQLRTVTFNSANALVVLISHAPSYLLTSGTSIGSILFRAVNYEIAAEMSNVKVVEMPDENLAGTANSYGEIAYGADRSSYDQQAYIKQGQDIFDLFKRWTLKGSRPSITNVIPTFYTIGDSQSVIPISAELQTANPSLGLYGPRTQQWIYNDQTASIELINTGVSCNMNTAGTITTKCGPLYTLSERLGDYYPDGVLFVHMGKNGSGAASSNASYTSIANGRWLKSFAENYPVFDTLVQNARNVAFTQVGNSWVRKIPATYGFVIQLGDNDVGSLANAQKYKSAMIQLIKDLRTDYGHKQYGIETPVILVKIHLSSFLGNAETRGIVRQAQEEIAKEVPNVGLVRVDDYDLSVDTIHLSSEAAMSIGRDIFNKYIELLKKAVPTL